MEMRNRYRILFIIFVVLGVYYPAIFAGVNSIDDYRMITEVNESARVDWKGLFLPGGGFYYRPLLMLTYYADKFLWDLSESFMHLENVLIHATNATLVFLIASRVFSKFDCRKLELPLLSALLFALHPINTEAVSWISGRTDPMAALFVLLSLLALLKGLDDNSYRYLGLSSLLLLLGCMTKEVAVFFLPGAGLIALFWQKQLADSSLRTVSKLQIVRQLLALAAPFFLGGAVYAAIRLFSHRSNPTGILQVFSGSPYDLLNGIRVVFKVFGFYVKKLFLPLPLNFAIVKMNDNYVWLGIAVFALLIFVFFRRRSIISAFFITACFLISPAILVSLSRIAWTPVAERYLYLPSAFFAMGIVGSLFLLLKRINKTIWIALSALIILPVATYYTEQRIIIWQNNLTLYQDTANKSPDFTKIKNELGIALAQNGRSAEGNQQFETANKIDGENKNPLVYLNQAILKMQKGEILEARTILLSTFADKKSANAEILKMLAKTYETELFKERTLQERRVIYREIIDIHDHLYLKTANPMSLYRAGQMALFLGEKKKAAGYFEKTYNVAPDGTYFKPAAKKLYEKLKL